MNAPVTAAHRQKCADLTNEARQFPDDWDAVDFSASPHDMFPAFAQYVANTEAREQSILSALNAPGSDADKLAAVRAIVEPVDPYVLEAERRLAERSDALKEFTIAKLYRSGMRRTSAAVIELAAALREGAGK